MPGHLFTEYFLTEGIRATSEWRASVEYADAFESFRDGVRERYEALSGSADPNEAVTEQELIRPVLELLGWADYLGHGLVSSPAIDVLNQTSRRST